MTKILFRKSVLGVAALAIPSFMGIGDALALDEVVLQALAGPNAMRCISELVKQDGELSSHDPEFAELLKARKQAAENYNHDIAAFRSWKQAFEEKRCDPNHTKPGTVWDAECEDILKNIVIANTAIQQDQALLAKATQSYLEHLQTHFGQLNKQVGNLQRWCSDAKFGKGPDADTSGSDDKSDSKKAKAEKPKQDNEKNANKPSDAEQATDSDDQGDDETTEDTGDETDVTQGPTEAELEAAFPDPDNSEATATSDGAASNNGDEDISKACASNPNCELLTGGVSQEPTDTDDQATETIDDGTGVTAEPDGDNVGTTDDTTENNSASEPDNTEELTDDSSGSSEATDGDDTAAMESDNGDDSSGASEPETTDNNSGTDEPDEVQFDPTAGLLE